MFYYLLSLFRNKISVALSLEIANNRMISKGKRNRALKKAGISMCGDVTIVPNIYFEFAKIILHDNVFINSGCIFLDNETITIKSDAMIGPGVIIATVSHHVAPALRHNDNIKKPVTICENAWIGAGAIIFPGVTVGKNSIVAAGSVVNKNVPKNTIFAGTPAEKKKNI
ncbi:acetyltransferase (plasmid) [Edwardsiella tarda]|uniref:DapH/DapD/GlmU-related protein n=1 Tax=Edwardsiella tarda TaxID=636 RepID=UPI0015E7E856|nr:DapH/DapD/GlmU-related protein [Edwardsiella tarda]UCQ29542.1 acetyltransferase [Edwardsiella tarda]